MHQFTIDDVAKGIAVYCTLEPTNDGISICKRASKLADVLGTLFWLQVHVVPDSLLTDDIRQLLEAALPPTTNAVST